ncbi:hypothetical protein OV208_20065 [Corallococcus sp. bb12-1]|uniref:hypothetical protein n=1 Tax=Corallococcus sp. bb12-1 TaxID=2996784 RepID=UPI00226DCF36|nr:hypothetical protein [Corallococcus sp. bb12-1]MCY1043625.1 hypothetical protein [Corallococcus sp. bb12-1]
MREIELKSVVDDLLSRRRHVEEAGGTLRFEGMMIDQHYTCSPARVGERLRSRTYRSAASTWVELTWKGPARSEQGYKVREELTTRVEDEAMLRAILERTGFIPQEHIEREIAWYRFRGATLRFEQFAHMDTLVEVEGPPEAIEHAIRATGIPRPHFTAAPLADFIQRFEARTGRTAVLRGEARTPPHRDEYACLPPTQAAP